MFESKSKKRNACQGCNKYMESNLRLYCDECLPRRRPPAPPAFGPAINKECDHDYKVLNKNLYNATFYCSKCLEIRSKEL